MSEIIPKQIEQFIIAVVECAQSPHPREAHHPAADHPEVPPRLARAVEKHRGTVPPVKSQWVAAVPAISKK